MPLLFRDLPFIRFPEDWEIKFLYNERIPIYFAVKKEGMPNTASVALLQSTECKEWDIAPLYEYGDGTCTICNTWDTKRVPLGDVESLLSAIKYTFDCEIIPDSLVGGYENET